jgi:hypothetical protein
MLSAIRGQINGIIFGHILLVDILYQIVFPHIFCAIAYYLTGQVNDFWRYLVCSSLMVFVSFCAQSQGLIFGAIFMNNLAVSTFSSCVSNVPIYLFGGFLMHSRHA